MKRSLKRSLVALFLLCVYPTLFADDSPTQVAKYFSASRKAANTVAHDADAFFAKSSDKRFAAKLMEVAKRNDKEALAKFIKDSVRMKSEVEVDEIDNDFCLKFHLKNKKDEWDVSLELHSGNCEVKKK